MSYLPRFTATIICAALVAAAGGAHAAVSHLYSGTQAITGSGYVSAVATAVDASGSVYTAGNFDGRDGTGGTADFNPGTGTDLRAPGGYSAYLTKHAADGSYQWTVMFSAGGQGGFIALEAVAAAGGGVYVTGLFEGTGHFGAGGDPTLQSVGGANRFVAKLTPAGATAWVRSNGLLQSSGIGVQGVLAADAGGVYMTGVVEASGQALDFDPTAGMDIITPRGTPAAYITRLTAAGDYVWTRVLQSAGLIGSSHVLQLELNPAGGIDVLAAFSGNLVLDPAARFGRVSASAARCAYHELVTRFLADGTYADWVWPLSPEYNAFALDGAGNIYLTGPFEQRRQFNPFYCSEGRRGGPGDMYHTNLGSAVITKLNTDGTYGWTRPFWSEPAAAAGGGVGQRLVTDTTGAAYIAGFTPDPITDQVSSDPVFLARFTPWGTMSWLKRFGAGSLAGAAIDAHNNIYVAGDFQQAADFDPAGSGDYQTPSGYESVYLSTFIFNPHNTAAVAHDARVATGQNETLTGTLTADDAEHDALTYLLVNDAGKGFVTITDPATGAFSYRPARDRTGTDQFTFVANDGQYNSNTGTVTVTIAAAPPGVDLKATAVDAPGAADAGSAIHVAATLANTGSSTADRTRLAFYLSTDANITADDYYLGYRSVPRLYANRSVTLGMRATIPRDAAAGHYYLGAVADYTHVVAESNEANNSIAAPFTVSAPDLVIEGLHAPAGAITPDSRVVFTVDYRNRGDSAAGHNRLAVYLSSDATIGPGDRILGSTGIPLTRADASGTATVTLRFPNVPSGTYYLGARVDNSNDVKESNENNNSADIPVTVGPR